MRKFLALLAGVFLALLVAFAYTSYRDGSSFFEPFSRFLDGGNEDPSGPGSDGPAVPDKPEENLSYDERIQKGDYYYDRGFLSFSVNEYVKAAKLEPQRVEPYFKLLKANYDLVNLDKARLNAETILSLDPSHFETQLYLVKIFIRQSQFEKTTAQLENLSSSYPDSPQVSYYTALLLLTQNNYDQAKSKLNEALALLPDEALAEKLNKILSAYSEYQFAQAAEELYLAELLVRSLNQIGEYEIAIHKLKEILKNRPDLRDSWILLGFAYLNLQKNYFALTSFEKAYEIDPEWPITQYFIGLTYTELGQKEDAIVYLNNALSNGFEPKIVLRRQLADLNLEVEDYEKAVTIYTDLLNESQQDVASFVRPIWIYLDYLNKPGEALKLAELAVMTFPENAMAYNLMGWSQTGTGNYVEAKKNLNKAIEMNPGFAAAYYNLGKLLVLQKEDDEALTAFQNAYDLDQNGSIGSLAAQRFNELME